MDGGELGHFSCWNRSAKGARAVSYQAHEKRPGRDSRDARQQIQMVLLQ